MVLLAGVILAPGRRTVTTALRILGRDRDPDFCTFHRILNRATWSSRAAAGQLLILLIKAFVPSGAPVVIGLDDTIERRWGPKISARGIYRDPVRSSKGHFVKASGLRWLSAMLLVRVPWADRIMALPFLTMLAPSKRFYTGKSRAPKTKLPADPPPNIAIARRSRAPNRAEDRARQELPRGINAERRARAIWDAASGRTWLHRGRAPAQAVGAHQRSSIFFLRLKKEPRRGWPVARLRRAGTWAVWQPTSAIWHRNRAETGPARLFPAKYSARIAAFASSSVDTWPQLLRPVSWKLTPRPTSQSPSNTS